MRMCLGGKVCFLGNGLAEQLAGRRRRRSDATGQGVPRVCEKSEQAKKKEEEGEKEEVL
jgi:hypothetical protein